MPADAAAVQQKTSRSPASDQKRWPLRSAAEGLPSSGGKAAYENTAGERKYCILYGGNSSKRWDGKKIMVDSQTLESLYNVEDLVLGKDVVIPWPGKGGSIENWKGVIVDPAAGIVI